MPIPGDFQSRWWVEASGVNPKAVEEYRPALIAFIAFDRGRQASIAGSGFIIAGNPQYALAITAKHVLTEGVARIQRPQFHAPSALFVSPNTQKPSLDPEKMKIIWMGAKHAAMVNALNVNYNETLDVACCVIEPQHQSSAPFSPTSIPLDTTIPDVGATVHMISHDNFQLSEMVPPSDLTGKGQQLSIMKRLSIRIGVVTGVFPNGLRQYKWPCFTTSIPAEPGMSGGLVTLPRNGGVTACCGVVCADNSTDEARKDWTKCGESVVASAWSALCLRVPDEIPATPETPSHSLYNFIQLGRMPEAVGGLNCIHFVEGQNGDCTLMHL